MENFPGMICDQIAPSVSTDWVRAKSSSPAACSSLGRGSAEGARDSLSRGSAAGARDSLGRGILKRARDGSSFAAPYSTRRRADMVSRTLSRSRYCTLNKKSERLRRAHELANFCIFFIYFIHPDRCAPARVRADLKENARSHSACFDRLH